MANGHGGPRAGKPGQAYPNRSDLNSQKMQVVPGQTYGKGAEQMRAQQAIPLPDNTPIPGQLGDLARGTDRPNEPLTAGAPFGAGPGPEVLPTTADDDLTLRLRALYAAMPNNDLLELIEELDSGRF